MLVIFNAFLHDYFHTPSAVPRFPSFASWVASRPELRVYLESLAKVPRSCPTGCVDRSYRKIVNHYDCSSHSFVPPIDTRQSQPNINDVLLYSNILQVNLDSQHLLCSPCYFLTLTTPILSRQSPEDALRLDLSLLSAAGDENAAVYAQRRGNVLLSTSILKCDYFQGCQNPKLPLRVDGAANCRYVIFFLTLAIPTF